MSLPSRHNIQFDVKRKISVFEMVKSLNVDDVEIILTQAREFQNVADKATSMQKKIAHYILEQNQYVQKCQHKFAYNALYCLRAVIPDNHENELTKLKLIIAFYALISDFNDDERKEFITQQCAAARKYTRSVVVSRRGSFFYQQPPAHLEALAQQDSVFEPVLSTT
jgi:hypothetical protein